MDVPKRSMLPMTLRWTIGIWSFSWHRYTSKGSNIIASLLWLHFGLFFLHFSSFFSQWTLREIMTVAIPSLPQGSFSVLTHLCPKAVVSYPSGILLLGSLDFFFNNMFSEPSHALHPSSLAFVPTPAEDAWVLVLHASRGRESEECLLCSLSLLAIEGEWSFLCRGTVSELWHRAWR